MGQDFDLLECEDLRVILQLMPGQLITELIGSLSPLRGSRLMRLARSRAFGRDDYNSLLNEVDSRIRRLAVHDVALVLQALPSYRDALLILCKHGSVEFESNDTVAELERKFLLKAFESDDNVSAKPEKEDPRWFVVGAQIFVGIFKAVKIPPRIQRILANMGAKSPYVAAAVLAGFAIIAAGGYLAGPAFARLENCVRIIALFRQAKFFEDIATEAA